MYHVYGCMELFGSLFIGHLLEVSAFQDRPFRLRQPLYGFFDLLYALLKIYYFFLCAKWCSARLQMGVAVYGLVVAQFVKAAVACGSVEESYSLLVVGIQATLTQHLPDGLKDAACDVLGQLFFAEKGQCIEVQRSVETLEERFHPRCRCLFLVTH